MDKYYKLSEPYNKGVKDKCPEWIGEILNMKKEQLSTEKINEIVNFSSNLSKPNKKYCSLCKNVLLDREIGKCSKCRTK